MLIKVNDTLYVHAKDIVRVKKITNTSSDNFGEWTVVVKEGSTTTAYHIGKGSEVGLVDAVNKYLLANK